MRLRRLAVIVTAAAAAVALPATSALAAGSAVFTSPGPDAAIGGSTEIAVQVSGDTGLFGGDHVVRVRLADLAQQHIGGTEVVSLACTGGDCRADSTWGGVTLNAATFAPFGAPAPACNGGYVLQVQVDDGTWAGQRIRIAAPPTAPGDVAVEPGVEQATITWTKAPQADVTGYRIERRSGGSWTVIGETGPGTTSFTDSGVAAGEVDYRVATLRGDGAVNGAPVQPCSDTGRDLATPSGAVPAEISAPPTSGGSSGGGTTGPSRPTPTPSPTATSSDPDGTPGDDPTAPTAGGGDDPAAPGDDPAAEDPAAGGTTDDGAAAPTVTRRGGQRVAPPAPIESTTRDRTVTRFGDPGTAADAPLVAGQQERYYGEDEEFSETIEYGESDPRALGEVTTETRTVRIPGALQSVLGEELDLRLLLGPIAAGMLLLTLGLHLRRWVRAGIEG